MVDEGEHTASSEPSQPASSAYRELLEVMACTTTRLDLVWGRERQKVAHGTFDEEFPSVHHHTAFVSADQASGFLQMMTVLQAYQADPG